VAKQTEDTKTIDMLGEKRGRGRPRVNPAPASDADRRRAEADRKAAQRARAKEEGRAVVVSFKMAPDLAAAFDAHLVKHRENIGPITRDEYLDKILRNQVMRKR